MRLNFIGNGSAWNIKLNNTSAFFKDEDNMLLIDCGESVAREIIRLDLLNEINNLYILITHTHSDHIGSLGTLLFYSKYHKKINNYLIVPNDNVYEDNIKAYLKISEISTEIQFENDEFLKNRLGLNEFQFLKATHVKSIPCYCFIFEDENNLLYYSGDNSNIEYIKKYIKIPNSIIYTEVSNNPRLIEEHLFFNTLLENTDFEDRKRIYLMHLDQDSDEKIYEDYGFNIAKQYVKK